MRLTGFCGRRSRSCWCLIAHRRRMFFRWFRRAQRFRKCCWKKNRHNRGARHMQTFRIRYRNTQGTLMRILNAASRRALDLPVVHAEPAEQDHQVTLALEVNQKQVGQLYREWYGIADVVHVGPGQVSSDAAHASAWTTAHPPAGVPIEDSRTAARA